MMQKSLSRLAFKAKSVNAKQQQAVTARMAGMGVGGTASIGAGQDIQAITRPVLVSIFLLARLLRLWCRLLSISPCRCC